MLSWITGARITNVTDELPDNLDATFIEPPETPAHLFPVRAFKQAIWGTPNPDAESNHISRDKSSLRRLQKKSKSVDIVNGLDLAKAPAQTGFVDYTKPSGILMTPGTASKSRKTVSFGAQVVDNEGKKPAFGKSGLPNDCPGKFPSPWTPKIASTPDEQKGRTKLTEALYEARDSSKAEKPNAPKPRAKDDTDITLDLSKPRSESGKYWKEQYDTFAENSMKETRELIKKKKTAKDYAMMKDREAAELRVQLEQVKRQHATQVRNLEAQNKELQGKLRTATHEVSELKHHVRKLKVGSSKRLPDRDAIRVFEEPLDEVFGNRGVAGGSPSRDRRSQQGRSSNSLSMRPSSSRRNTSPSAHGSSRNADAVPLRIPLQEREANSVREPASSAGKGSNRAQASITSPSPDPWMPNAEDYPDYHSPSKLDQLNKPPPPVDPRSASLPTNMAQKAKAALSIAHSDPADAPYKLGHRSRRHSITAAAPRSRPLYAPASHVRVQSAVDPRLGMSHSNNSFSGSTSSRRAIGEKSSNLDAERAARARARVADRRQAATGGSMRS